MASFSLPEIQLSAGKRTFNSLSVPAKPYKLELTPGSSEWDAKTGSGPLTFGFEGSTDGGASWAVLAAATIQVGERNKIGIPTMGLAVEVDQGMAIRPFVICPVAIRLSASGTVI